MVVLYSTITSHSWFKFPHESIIQRHATKSFPLLLSQLATPFWGVESVSQIGSCLTDSKIQHVRVFALFSSPAAVDRVRRQCSTWGVRHHQQRYLRSLAAEYEATQLGHRHDFQRDCCRRWFRALSLIYLRTNFLFTFNLSTWSTLSSLSRQPLPPAPPLSLLYFKMWVPTVVTTSLASL